MPCRLRTEEVVTIRVLTEKGASHCQVARTLGLSEGTVRYHLRRAPRRGPRTVGGISHGRAWRS
jgi:DNA-binding NarL/FixJ family response regulator